MTEPWMVSLAAVFVSAALMLLVFDRLNHPAIPAYIVAGAFIGHLTDTGTLLGLAEVGIAFLVFIFGIKTEVPRLRTVARESIVTAVVQMVVVATVVYWFATGIGIPLFDALYISFAAAISSSLVGLELIEDELRLNVIHGRLAESINLIQDVAGIFVIVALLTAPLTVGVVGTQVAWSVLIVITGLVFRQYSAPVLSRVSAGSRDMMLLIGASSLAFFTVVTASLGLPMIVGAFAAGLSLARFPYNLEVLDAMGSLKDFFSAIFFVTLGALLTIPQRSTIGIALGLILIVTVLKPAVTVLLLTLQGYDTRTAYLTSLSNDHISEFVLMAIIPAVTSGLISSTSFDAIVIAATVTMLISSYTTRYGQEIYQTLLDNDLIETNYAKLNVRSQMTDELSGHIIIAGNGIQGKLLAARLREAGETPVLIDNDPERITEAAKHHEHYVYGNAVGHHVWEQSRANDAKIIVSTIPDPYVSQRIMSLDTPAKKILRATSKREAEQLTAEGATYIERPRILAAEQIDDQIDTVLTGGDAAEALKRQTLHDIAVYLDER